MHELVTIDHPDFVSTISNETAASPSSLKISRSTGFTPWRESISTNTLASVARPRR